MSTLLPAHAFGAGHDLPIPLLLLLLLVAAGVAVVVVSFLVVHPRAVGADDANADGPDRVPEVALNLPTTVVSGQGGLRPNPPRTIAGESETDHDRRPVLAVGSLKAWESRGSGPLSMGTERHAPRPGRLSLRTRSNHAWTRHRPRFMWAFSALLVAVGWLLTPHPVPVYDGIGMPDEPYRYVSTPPGASVTAKPAGGAQGTLSVVGGVNPRVASLRSDESGPQVWVYLPAGVLAAPGGKITVKVVPLAPTHPPADGPIDGNVYRVSITNPAGPVTFKSPTSTIVLRATTAKQPGPVIEYRLGPGQKWRLLDTSRTGNDIYGSPLPEAGEYALVYSKLAHPREPTRGTGAFNAQGLIIGLIVLFFLLLSVVFVVRTRRQEVDQ